MSVCTCTVSKEIFANDSLWNDSSRQCTCTHSTGPAGTFPNANDSSCKAARAKITTIIPYTSMMIPHVSQCTCTLRSLLAGVHASRRSRCSPALVATKKGPPPKGRAGVLPAAYPRQAIHGGAESEQDQGCTSLRCVTALRTMQPIAAASRAM